MTKKINLIIFMILSCNLFINYVNCQNVYYYYNGMRQNLSVDSNSIVLYFKEEFSYKNRDSTFSDTNLISIDASDGTEDILMARLTSKLKIQNIFNYLNTMGIYQSDIDGYSYGYKTDNGSNFWPTMDIVFRLKTGVQIDSLNELFNKYEATFISEKYDVYDYKIQDIKNVFILADTIYTKGFAEWSEPDFYTNISIFSDPYFPDLILFK